MVCSEFDPEINSSSLWAGLATIELTVYMKCEDEKVFSRWVFCSAQVCSRVKWQQWTYHQSSWILLFVLDAIKINWLMILTPWYGRLRITNSRALKFNCSTSVTDNGGFIRFCNYRGSWRSEQKNNEFQKLWYIFLHLDVPYLLE